MPHFHETIGGRTFYEGHVPKIVSALTSIAKSLESIEARLTSLEQAHDCTQASAEDALVNLEEG